MTLSNAESVDDAVNFINSVNEHKDHLVDHYGWGEVAAQYQLNDYAAAQYAWEASEDESIDSIKTNLEFIKNEGANFNFEKSLVIAEQFIKESNTLTAKMNIEFGSSNEDLVVEIDARRNVNIYDTFCQYCADNNVNLKDIDDSDFNACVELIENFVTQANDDTGYKISFWLS